MAMLLAENLWFSQAAYAQGSPLRPEDALAKLMAGNERLITAKRTNRHH